MSQVVLFLASFFFTVLLSAPEQSHIQMFPLLLNALSEPILFWRKAWRKIPLFALLLHLLSPRSLYQCRNGEFEEFDLIHFAQKLRVAHAEIEVYLKKNEIITKTRLSIAKVPDQAKAHRLRKLNHISRKKGYTTRKRIKILTGFNLYITNAPVTALASEHIRALYGIRW